jgi:tripeptidyl-peptidase-1
MAPAPSSLAAVTQWLAANNVSTQPVPGYGDWLGIQPTVQEASVLFATNFSVYKHVGTGVTQVRTLQYSIPKSLKGHLEVADPLVGYAAYSLQAARYS